MNQIKLLNIANGLDMGQAIKILNIEMVEATRGDFSALDAGSVRQNDVVEFAEKISENWGVVLTYDMVYNEWTMYKPTPMEIKGGK